MILKPSTSTYMHDCMDVDVEAHTKHQTLVYQAVTKTAMASRASTLWLVADVADRSGLPLRDFEVLKIFQPEQKLHEASYVIGLAGLLASILCLAECFPPKQCALLEKKTKVWHPHRLCAARWAGEAAPPRVKGELGGKWSGHRSCLLVHMIHMSNEIQYM